jgi:hypothetical protein
MSIGKLETAKVTVGIVKPLPNCGGRLEGEHPQKYDYASATNTRSIKEARPIFLPLVVRVAMQQHFNGEPTSFGAYGLSRYTNFMLNELRYIVGRDTVIEITGNVDEEDWATLYREDALLESDFTLAGNRILLTPKEYIERLATLTKDFRNSICKPPTHR